jgi:hypothetical protein
MTTEPEEDIRFYVELTTLDIEDVGAEQAHFVNGGDLVFLDEDGNLVIAYAAGTWRTVTRG